MSKAGLTQRVLPGLSLVARIAIGGIFLVAGASKLRDPSAFAVEIDHYELWPALAPYLAVTLPSIEIVLGLALWVLPRVWRQAAALGCGLLMAAFTFAAAAALWRGLDIDCGCFGSGSGSITWLTLVRDGVLLGACAWLAWDPLAAYSTSVGSEQALQGRGLTGMLGRAWLRAFGWQVAGGRPDVNKAVVVAAPHTSNWDLPFTLAIAWSLGVRIRWVGKHTLFRFPFGPLVRALGGLAVDRRGRHDAVTAIAELMQHHDKLLLVIPPEGTRDRADRWKTGFYYIALAARVPIVLGFLDYKRKRGGLGHVFRPSGVLEADLAELRAFYADIRGKYPACESEIVFRIEDRPPAKTD